MKSDRKAMLCIKDSKMSKEYTRHISLIKTLSLYWTFPVCTALTDTDYSSAYSCLKTDNNYVTFDYFDDLFLSFPMERMNYCEENLIFQLKVKMLRSVSDLFSTRWMNCLSSLTLISRYFFPLYQLRTIDSVFAIFKSLVPFKYWKVISNPDVSVPQKLISIPFCFLLKTDYSLIILLSSMHCFILITWFSYLFPSFAVHRCLLFALYRFMCQSPVSPGFEVGTSST